MLMENIFGMVVFGSSIVLLFLTVPWQRIKEFALLGLIAGVLLAVILVHIMQNLLGVWIFHRADFTVFGIPVFLSLAWTPLEIFFAHFLSNYRNILLIIGIILALPLGATFLHFLMLENKMLTYHHWNLMWTFLFSLAIHLGIAYYIYATGKIKTPVTGS